MKVHTHLLECLESHKEDASNDMHERDGMRPVIIPAPQSPSDTSTAIMTRDADRNTYGECPASVPAISLNFLLRKSCTTAIDNDMTSITVPINIFIAVRIHIANLYAHQVVHNLIALPGCNAPLL